MDWTLSQYYFRFNTCRKIYYYYDYTERHYKIQPLDIYGFRIWKNFVKRFSDTVLLLESNINLHTINEII